LERSNDGIEYAKVFDAYSKSANGLQDFSFTDNVKPGASSFIYYRVKIVTSNGETYYSRTVKVANKQNSNSFIVNILPKAGGNIQVNYFTKKDAPVEMRIVDMNGRVFVKYSGKCSTGNNSISFDTRNMALQSQTVIVQLIVNKEMLSQKIILF
jgi:hypothetical protein